MTERLRAGTSLLGGTEPSFICCITCPSGVPAFVDDIERGGEGKLPVIVELSQVSVRTDLWLVEGDGDFGIDKPRYHVPG